MKRKILIELTVDFDESAAGEFDDSAQYLLETGLMKYEGVKSVQTNIISPLDDFHEMLEREEKEANPVKLHIHFNNQPEQVCRLQNDLAVGETATVHLHISPDDCQICPNGHCHAPNVSLSRINGETLFLSFEQTPVFDCDIKNLPLHEAWEH